MRIEVRAVSRELVEGLIQDLFRPFGLDQTRDRDPDKQVSQRGRIEHIGVVHDNEWHYSIPISCESLLSSSAASSRSALYRR